MFLADRKGGWIMDINTFAEETAYKIAGMDSRENKGYEAKQFVVFRIGNEEYGVDIQRITTIERIMGIARVPKTPPHIKGVINLRGEIIPVICMRTKFNLPLEAYGEDTRVVIFKADDNSIGIIVDSVAEVIQLKEEDIETIGSFTNELLTDYILGVGKVDGRIITLLNLEKIIII